MGRWVKDFEIAELIESMRISTAQYLRYGDEDPSTPTRDSVEKAWRYVAKIARRRKSEQEKPYPKELFSIVYGTLNSNFPGSFETWEAIDIMEHAYLNGVSVVELKKLARDCHSYWQFSRQVEELAEQSSSEPSLE